MVPASCFHNETSSVNRDILQRWGTEILALEKMALEKNGTGKNGPSKFGEKMAPETNVILFLHLFIDSR